MPTLTATGDNTKSQVRLDLDFSDIDAPYALVNRVDPTTGATTAVRGHGASVTISGVAYAPMLAGYKAVLYDTEVPLDNSVYYTATAPAVTMNATPNFTGGYVDPWYAAVPATNTVRITSSSGTNFLSFFTDGTPTNPTIRGDYVPATPGAVFTITASVSANVSQSASVGFAFQDATGTFLSQPFTTATVLAATTITATATAPANTVTVQPFVFMNGTPAATTILSVSTIVLTSAAGSATSAALTVASLGACRLKDPLRPGNNVRIDFAFDPNPLCVPAEGVFFQSLDVEQQAANAATFNINNRANPVVVSKIRSSITSTLTLVSRTFPDRDRLNTVLAPGSPLLFQAPDEYGLPDRYLSVGTTGVSRLLPDHRIPLRVFSLPHAVVSSPASLMQGTVAARWSDTCNQYATWAAVNAAAKTWINVLDGGIG